MKWISVVVVAAALVATTAIVYAAGPGFSGQVNCAGYSYTLTPTGWDPSHELISLVALPVGPGSYSWNGATSVHLYGQVIFRRINGSTYAFEWNEYLYKPGGCTPEEEAGPPPAAGYVPPCERHVLVTVEPGAEVIWDGHMTLVAGPDGKALIEWAPAGVHTLESGGIREEIALDSDFCETYAVSLLPSLPVPLPQPIIEEPEPWQSPLWSMDLLDVPGLSPL